MNIKITCQLHALEFQSKVFLCRVRVTPRLLQYFSDQKAQPTHRWMHAEDWAIFDSTLKKILAKWCEDDEPTWNGEKHFLINPLIRVQIRASDLNPKTICRILDMEEQQSSVALVVDCDITYSGSDLQPQKAKVEKDQNIKQRKQNKKVFHEEYEPTGQEAVPGVLYTPSSKINGVVEDEPYEVASSSLKNIYTPTPIKQTIFPATEPELSNIKNAKIEDEIDRLTVKRKKRDKLTAVKKVQAESRDGDSLTKATKASKTTKNPIEQHLFGSDDELEIEKSTHLNAIKTSMKKSPIVAGTSKSHKRKLLDCGQEKASLSKWLSTPTPTVACTKSKGKVSSKNEDAVSTESLHSEYEPLPTSYLTQLESHMQVDDLLKDPGHVNYLSLDHLKEKQIVGTFAKHKERLDYVFEKLKNKHNVNGFDGIDYYKVASLVPDTIMRKMLQKLSLVYEPDSTDTMSYNIDISTVRPHLRVNVLLPEWIVCVYMAEHGFTRDEAIHHIKAQEHYRMYLQNKEAGSNN